MNRLIFILVVALSCNAINAQTLNVETGYVTYAIPASQAGEMTFADGSLLTVMGRTVALADITAMYVDDSEVTDNTVEADYSGDTVRVTVAGNIARYVTATVDGAHLRIVQSDDVDESTCGEITYILSGESVDGSFYMEGSYKATVELHGLTLANASGAAIDIQNGKRIELSVKSGTVNTLTDCADGSQKGCIVCKGHLELKGKGTLNVSGNTAHAIYAKEYVEMKNCTVNVASAVKDGVNCNQYFRMESGSLAISGTGDDGLQVSFKDDADREAEDTGSITIAGGTVNVDVTATAAKGLKADGSVSITGGTIGITTAGGGEWDEEDVKTKASTCISADADMTIDGGTLTLTSTGSGGKGISCDSVLTINGGGMGGGDMPGNSAVAILVTCDGLVSGNSYTLNNGSATSTVTARTNGNADNNRPK